MANAIRSAQYVDGDYREASTYQALRRELGAAERPLHYLAIPPSMFATVAANLATAGCAKNARVVVEKPFGRDLASAQALDSALHEHFPEAAIFRIDHYLGKETVQNLLYFRFANSFLGADLESQHIHSVQITMAENFGVQGRGRFYEEVGAIRDVVQNHLLQVMVLLAMDPPASQRERLHPRRENTGYAGHAPARSQAASCAANTTTTAKSRACPLTRKWRPLPQ